MQPLPASGAFDPDLAEWDAWQPDEAARRLERVEAPWYIAAGWAIDLVLGGPRREHDDLELAAPSDRFDELVAALAGFEFFVVGDRLAVPLAEAGNALETYYQTWLLDRAAGVWRLDVFREPSEADTLERLEPDRRRWLAHALGLVHPGHRWLDGSDLAPVTNQ